MDHQAAVHKYTIKYVSLGFTAFLVKTIDLPLGPITFANRTSRRPLWYQITIVVSLL